MLIIKKRDLRKIKVFVILLGTGLEPKIMA